MVGRPVASRAQPSGIGLAQRAATDSFPMATVLVAMSSTNGYSRPAGAANEMGLVLSMDCRPNVGTTAGDGPLVRLIPIMSWGSAIIE